MKPTNFTAYSDEWINKSLKTQLDEVCDEILRSLPDVKSIILVGGFARGEGSVKIVGNKVTPINDYDIYVISDEPISEPKLVNVSKKATRRIGMMGINFYSFDQSYSFDSSFYVDLRCIPLNKLDGLPPLIKYFEMKYTGKILYGEDVLDHIPNFKATDIPLSEGARFLLNRMSELVEWFSPKYLERGLSESERETLIYACAKAFLSCCTALLLLNGTFRPTYVDRLRALRKVYKKSYPDLYKKLPYLLDKIALSTNIKLSFNFEEIRDPISFWFTTRDYLSIVSQFFFKKFLQMNETTDWERFSRELYKKMWKRYFTPYIRSNIKRYLHREIPDFFVFPLILLSQIYLNLIYISRIRHFMKILYLRPLLYWGSPDMRLYPAAPLILNSIDRNGEINSEMLEIALDYIKRSFPADSDVKGSAYDFWERVKHSYATAYRLYAFQKII